MSRGLPHRLRDHCLAVLLSAVLAPASGHAQGLASITGSVTDSLGVGLARAIVTVTGNAAGAVTNERGEFRLEGLAVGPAEIQVRRLGFAPATQRIQLSANNSPPHLRFTLKMLPTAIAPVVVQADHVRYEGRLAGYYQRLERRSSGVFIDRAELDRRNYRSLSQLLAQSPGVSAGKIYAGGGSVRMRGRRCPPLVWLDGVPMPAGEVDLDGFPVSTIHGVELYLGSTTAPSDFTVPQGMSNCGTILLWSRGPDTETSVPVRRPSTDAEAVTDARSFYVADEVDNPARLLNGDSLGLVYPAALFAAGVEGSVLVEFVVDTAGSVEPETFGVVSFSNPAFVAAVTRVIERASYSPAMKYGRPVRQLVHQPFSFVRRLARAGHSSND